MSETEFHYRTDFTPEQLRQEILSGLRDSDMKAEAERKGLDMSGLHDPADSFTVERTTEGLLGWQEIDLIFCGLAAKILADVWKHILLPRLERRYGVGKLKPIEK